MGIRAVIDDNVSQTAEMDNISGIAFKLGYACYEIPALNCLENSLERGNSLVLLFKLCFQLGQLRIERINPFPVPFCTGGQ